MKSRFFVFAIVLAAFVFLYKRLIDTEEKFVFSEAELAKLQRENAAREQAYAEANQRYQEFEREHPLPDDPDKKMRVAMLDAILSANVRAELGENHIDFESFDEEKEDDS